MRKQRAPSSEPSIPSHNDAMPAQKPPQQYFSLSTHALYGSLAGGFGLLAVVFLSVCIAKRNRHSYQGPLRPQTAVALKYANVKGPGGLKNSPSSLPSPLSSDSSQSSPVVPVRPSLPSPQTLQRVQPSQLGPHRGFINFTLRYNIASSALQVNIVSCRDLPELAIAADGQCLLDPYVKLQLLPEKQHRVKTRLVRATRNPVYEETFSMYGIEPEQLNATSLHFALLPEKQHRVKTRLVRATRNPVYEETFSMYGIEPEQLNATSLHFAVIAFDRYSRDTLLAEAVYPLKEAQLSVVESKSVELELGGRGEDLGEDRGQILISLCYQPTTNRVAVVLLKAKNLPKFDITGMADPYVKLYMVYNGQRIAKKKSHVKKRTLSPVYNESFVFELPSSDLRDLDSIQFEIVVMDWDRVTKNEVMGRCVIGSLSEHWSQVRNNPRRQIAEWHALSR
ncbi:Synaptotagmin-4 [Toxocara canis]|uniref:Synaptotagmin-4 n=1 Tax=Toxocara canis TaxID=6265 RepID=A0A0B2VRE5_TOXCA|nr:Synaptotagmin-4 [Toxocara canis]